jgi:hypothetical protein
MTEVITLKDGTQEAKPLVAVTMMSLKRLLKDNTTAFFDLVMKCRDGNYEFFGNNGDTLRSLGFIDSNGGIHRSMKNIILNATEGEGIDMKLVRPY